MRRCPPHQTSPSTTPRALPPLSEAALQQWAMDAGITVELARKLALSQLAAMNEARGS